MGRRCGCKRKEVKERVERKQGGKGIFIIGNGQVRVSPYLPARTKDPCRTKLCKLGLGRNWTVWGRLAKHKPSLNYTCLGFDLYQNLGLANWSDWAKTNLLENGYRQG